MRVLFTSDDEGFESFVEEVTSAVIRSTDYCFPWKYKLFFRCMNGDVIEVLSYFTTDRARSYIEKLCREGTLDLSSFKSRRVKGSDL